MTNNGALSDFFGTANAHKPLILAGPEQLEQRKHVVLMADGFSVDINGYEAEDVALICASVLRCAGLPLDEEPLYGLTLAGEELLEQAETPEPEVNFFFAGAVTSDADDDEELLVDEIA